MATLNQNGLPTLLDLAKRLDPDGKYAQIAETLSTDCPLINDIPWKQANGADGHLVTQRNALPGLSWRKYNQGVVPTKSGTSQFTETMGMLDGISNVDVKLAKRNGDAAAFRASEDKAFIMAYRRVLENAFFYSSTKTTPEQIMGLSPRMDTLAATHPFASQIISFGAAGSNDQASIWLVGWGEGKVYGIYPPNSMAGLEMKDMGEELVSEGSGYFRAYRSAFSWQCGLVVEDARYLVRLCNIDDDVVTSTGSALIDAMARMCEQIQSTDDCKPVFYMNRAMRSLLRRQSIDSTKNSTLTYENVGGKPVLSFSGIPIHRTDALINTEAPVTA